MSEQNRVTVTFVSGLCELSYTYYENTSEYTLLSVCGHHGTLKPLDESEVPAPVLKAFRDLEQADFEV